MFFLRKIKQIVSETFVTFEIFALCVRYLNFDTAAHHIYIRKVIFFLYPASLTHAVIGQKRVIVKPEYSDALNLNSNFTNFDWIFCY